MMQSSPLNVRRATVWIGRLIIGGILIYAGYAKLFLPTMHPRPPVSLALSLFALQVDSYQILPPAAVSVVAHVLPFAEIIIGAFLILGWPLRFWTTLSTVLIAGFFALVLRSYLLHMQINCGCFATAEPLTVKTVIRDGALLTLAVVTTIFAFIESGHQHPWSSKSAEPTSS
jgi:uncharacterized membrane protein YphA (DoxX/SURF4 family)